MRRDRKCLAAEEMTSTSASPREYRSRNQTARLVPWPQGEWLNCGTSQATFVGAKPAQIAFEIDSPEELAPGALLFHWVPSRICK